MTETTIQHRAQRIGRIERDPTTQRASFLLDHCRIQFWIEFGDSTESDAARGTATILHEPQIARGTSQTLHVM